MSHSTQREVELTIATDEDGDHMLSARHPNGVEEWLCGSVENPRSCYSTYAAELNMLCYGKARERIDLVVETEDGAVVGIYKEVDNRLWRRVSDNAYVSYVRFMDTFLNHGVRYYLR